MPTYTYTARDENGSVQTGNLDALTEDEVIGVLQHRGLLVTAISERDLSQLQRPAARRAKSARRMHVPVKTDDLVLLCQQLSTLVEAGVPLMKCLEVAASQVESQRLLLALEEIRRDVAAGRTFRDALAKHPTVFSALWLNLVETGEASGHLAEALKQLAHHFELAQHLQNETRTALTYPAFLGVAAVGVLAVFVYWLIPKFSAIFATMAGLEMPPLTKAVIGLSHAARKYWVIIIMGTAGLIYALKAYLRTTAGQWTRDRLMLKIPLFNTLFSYIQLAEFSRGLSTLLESGVPLLSSLEILERSATNKIYGQAIGQVREQVKEGKSMAQPMEETGLFPAMTVQMVQVGEEVGELAKMVARIAKYYEERVETFIARMTRLFEPIAIVVMGGLVLLIVLSIFLPIFKMAGGIKAGS
ncbi:MAG: type II secretion system F family protein [Candidatus Omnitrophica bacterium]|nr:type II secretion system F family protein [Candidatus Omnitrophota bacterium]